ncbi:hypothetical protein EJB05_53432 [Eragrostis curvula]|uniref:SKP1 component POZ domain-containing protein n=1 Tax=Eragrostis curvula TaxID=38414 RepID=A0A5J9SQ59_9POAL|nr:hypothetical protein EJB05_53432 [Eragrostis curvula]
MASTAAVDKGKRPMYPEDDPTDGVAAAGEKQPAEEGEGAEGRDDDLVLVTESGTELRLSRLAARMSTMLSGMMEGDCAEGRIPVPNVDAGILRLVVAYCEKHAPHYDPESAGRDRDPFPPFPIDLTPATHAIKPVTEPDPDPHGLKAWDQQFIPAGMDNSILFAIILMDD